MDYPYCGTRIPGLFPPRPHFELGLAPYLPVAMVRLPLFDLR